MINPQDLKKISWQCVHYALPEEVKEIRTELENFDIVVVDCNVGQVKNDADLFKTISTALNFPDYFGNNWDAFEECLSDMEWLPTKSYVLMLFDAENLWKDATYTAGKLSSIWQLVAKQWADEKTAFHLVFIL